MKRLLCLSAAVLAISALAFACGHKDGGGGGAAANRQLWTWMSGADTGNQAGVYGIKGVAFPANTPGSRDSAVSWTDGSGDLWLFGGYGIDSAGGVDFLNDLWKFDGSAWTWVGGSNVINQPGVYGTKGAASLSNVPGARYGAASWADGNGNVWFFGGNGYDSAGGVEYLNDLWKFDGSAWTWVSGSNSVGQPGVYGTKGVTLPSNVPGGREYAVLLGDGSGNLWLFGGEGYDSTGGVDYLNDLWKFDGSAWTWVGGSNITNQPGVYGIKGVASSSNTPGAREYAVSWGDESGNVWLFGGSGRDSAGAFGNLNDLWKFDGSNWTWVSGSNIADQPAVYGTKGVTLSSNVPGARYGAVSWSDGSGDLWLSGGWAYDSTNAFFVINDLWKFDGSNWTWVSGANIVSQPGVYGMKGIPASGNVPGARAFAAMWGDGSGGLWIFGGLGYDSTGTYRRLNDLMRFNP